MGPGSSGHGQEEDIPLYDYAFSAASCGPAPKGTPTDVRSCSATFVSVAGRGWHDYCAVVIGSCLLLIE